MRKKITITAIVVLIIAAFFVFDIQQYISLEKLQQQQTDLQNFYRKYQIQTIIGYFVLYVIVTAISLPGATVMTLAGGAIFGFRLGVVIVSFASSIGATLAFLFSRYVFKDTVEKKFNDFLQSINEGIEKEGSFYLFSLRLIPIFPFFVINLVFGVTKMKTWNFYWVSQLGMLAGTMVYVNAGTQIRKIRSSADIISLEVLVSFALLGIFPLLSKKIIERVKSNMVG